MSFDWDIAPPPLVDWGGSESSTPLERAPQPAKRGPAPLLANQLLCVEDTESKIIICRGGYRSGKTGALVAKAIDLGRRHWPHPVLAVEPSYTMILSVFVDAATRLCAKWNLPCHYSVSRKTLWIGRRNPVRILCRSADKPRSLEGLTVGSLVGDEWELWPIQSLKVAMARVSIGPLQQKVLGGTPEGFGPGYKLLEEKPKPGTRIIIMRTVDNHIVTEENPDYVEDTRSTLSESEAKEKLEGERSAPEARVFTRWENEVHTTFAAVDNDARIEVWAGFKEHRMVWAFVLVDDTNKAFHVVGELVREHTDSQVQTNAAIEWLVRWFARGGAPSSPKVVRAREIPAICDAEGNARTARAPKSHVVNVREGGLLPRCPPRNPSDPDRVASIQKVLGEKRFTVDAKAAPFIAQSLANLRRAPDGSIVDDGMMIHAVHVIGNGIMVHSPAHRPATAFEEQRARERWRRSQQAADLVTESVSAGVRPDIARMLPQVLQNRIAKACVGGKRAGDAVRDLGCSIAEFARYIEAQFRDGMTWDNYGKNGWELDHKRPLASFDLEDRAQFMKAAHFSNYQPLWAHENKKKGVRWNGDA